MQEALSKVDVTVQPVIKLGSAIHEKRGERFALKYVLIIYGLRTGRGLG